MDQQPQTSTPPVNIMRLKSVVGKEEIGRSSDGHPQTVPQFGPIDFPVQEESDITGMGQPMSLPFLIGQIIEYNTQYGELYADLEKQQSDLNDMIKLTEEQGVSAINGKIIDKLKSMLDVTNRAYELVGRKEIAIDLGKESLMLILSQKDCEGIRFYFCNSPYGSNSVAAVGIRTFLDDRGQPQQRPHPQDPNRNIADAQDIGVNKNFHSILEPGAIDEQTQILNEEVGPPYRIRQMFGHKLTPRPEDLENGFTDALQAVL